MSESIKSEKFEKFEGQNYRKRKVSKPRSGRIGEAFYHEFSRKTKTFTAPETRDVEIIEVVPCSVDTTH